MRELWIWSALLCAGLSSSCDTQASAVSQSEAVASKGLVLLNDKAKEFSFRATFHRANAVQGTWHLLVEGTGSMASKAFFTTDVSPAKLYESLKAIGAEDGNNVSSSNFADEAIATQGDAIDFYFDWKGLKHAMPLQALVCEVVPNLPTSGGARGLDMRFGGNFTNEDAKRPPCHESGCLACLYTCNMGVTSNARANLALLKKEKDVHRYKLNPVIDLPDGASVRVIVRRLAASGPTTAPAPSPR